jgi:hypothetical protein
MKSIFFSLLSLSLLLAFGACKNKSKGSYSNVKTGQPFELKMNQSVQLEGGDLKLTFTGVPEDSRCPEGVNCIQEGQARVSLVATTGGESKPVLIAQKPSQKIVSQAIGNYTLQLVMVKPYPKQGLIILPEDYVLTMNIKGN